MIIRNYCKNVNHHNEYSHSDLTVKTNHHNAIAAFTDTRCVNAITLVIMCKIKFIGN